MIKKLLKIFFPEARINVPVVEEIDDILPRKRREKGPDDFREKRRVVSSQEFDIKKTLRNAEKILRLSNDTNSKREEIRSRKFDISDTDQESLKKKEKNNFKDDRIIEVDESEENDYRSRKNQKRDRKFIGSDEEGRKEKRFFIQTTGLKNLKEKKSLGLSFSLPKGIITELPRSKQQLKHLQVHQTDDINQKLSKLFQSQNLGKIYSNSITLSSSIPPKQVPSPIKIQSDGKDPKSPKDFSPLSEDCKSLSDKHSNLTDSFFTPEDSPLLSASPEPSKISTFQLESPISQLRNELPSSGWGDNKSTSLAASPFFPESQERKFEVRPNVLFSPFSVDKSEKIKENQEILNIDCDLVKSRENSLNTLKDLEEKNQVFEEREKIGKEIQSFNPVQQNNGLSFSSEIGRGFVLENRLNENPVPSLIPETFINPFQPFSSSNFSSPAAPSLPGPVPDNPFLQQKSPSPDYQQSNPSLVLNKDSSNPFLNISQASISTPKYQFGKGSIPLPQQDPGVNPFITNRF
jgi:hypothetical protein